LSMLDVAGIWGVQHFLRSLRTAIKGEAAEAAGAGAALATATASGSRSYVTERVRDLCISSMIIYCSWHNSHGNNSSRCSRSGCLCRKPASEPTTALSLPSHLSLQSIKATPPLRAEPCQSARPMHFFRSKRGAPAAAKIGKEQAFPLFKFPITQLVGPS